MDDDSPPSSIMSVMSNQQNKPHRETKEMPYRLRQAVAVYLDNKQFLEGFTFLHQTLTAGRSTPSAPPVPIPPASFHELAATLAVHPQYTTRAKSPEDLRAANDALKYLRDTITIVNPVAANLATAFTFHTPSAQRATARRKRKRGENDPFAREGYRSASVSHGSDGSEDDSDDDTALKTPFASGEKSVFRQRGSELGFWSVVGWAFNCSVRHKKRWERWRAWLEVMCEVLEEDLGIRTEAALDAVTKNGADTKTEWEKVARESLIGKYLDGHVSGRGGIRRVVSSILADGSEKAMREFGEVWKNETKEKKIKKDDASASWQQHKKLDLENDEWGDYGMKDDEDELAEEDEDEEMDDVTVNAELDSGGSESMKLRQRFMILLIHVAATLPIHFTNVEHLYDVYTELIRPLPLAIFRDFLAMFSPPKESLPANYHIALLINLILPLLSTMPRRSDIESHTQATMTKYYFPHAANGTSFSDNAKMSLLIEHLLFYMWTDDRLTPSVAFTNAVEKGIKARAAKAIGDGRKRDKGQAPEEQNAKIMLELSGERIQMLIGMIGADDTTAGAETENARFGRDGTMSSSSQLSDMTPTPSLDNQSSDEGS